MKKNRTFKFLFFLLFALLLGVFVVLPLGVRTYINYRLSHDPDYAGAVGAVWVNPLNTSLNLGQFYVKARTAPAQEALALQIAHTRLALNAQALLHGHLQTSLSLDVPDLYWVVQRPQKKAATPPTDIWQQMRGMLWYSTINEIDIHQGILHYVDLTTDPVFKIEARDIEAHAIDLQTHDLNTPAQVNASAKTIGDGGAQFYLKFYPGARQPRFAMTFSLEHLQLNKINTFLEAYTELHAQQGEFNFYLSANAKNGYIQGYAKPLFQNLKLANPPQDENKPLKKLYKSVMQGLSNLFKNNESDNTAIKIKFSGPINDPNASMGSVIGSLLRNAFLEALLPGFD